MSEEEFTEEELEMENMTLVAHELSDEITKAIEYAVGRSVDLRVSGGVVRTGISHTLCNMWIEWLKQLDRTEAAKLFHDGCDQIADDILDKVIEGAKKNGNKSTHHS